MGILLGISGALVWAGPRRACAASLAAVVMAVLTPASAEAGFGISSIDATASNRDGTLDLRAGAHPYEYTVGLTMNQNAQQEPEGSLRAVVLNLPPGLVGNPSAVPRCARAEFDGVSPHCPARFRSESLIFGSPLSAPRSSRSTTWCPRPG